MINFLKSFAKGILYLLVLPAIIVALAIYAVVALVMFIYLAIKGIVLFFTGRSLYDDLPEDIEAKKRLNPTPAAASPTPTTNTNTNDVIINTTPIVETPNSNDPFYVPEYLKSQEEVEETPTMEEPKEESQPLPEEPKTEPLNNTIVEEEYHIEPPVFEEPKKEVKDDDLDTISVQKTRQNQNIFEIDDTDDDDDNHTSGINIDFD